MSRRIPVGVLALWFAVTTLAPVAAARPRPLPPDLRPLSPPRIQGPTTGMTGFSLTSLTPYLVNGCLPEEMVRTGAARCLRFDTVVLNAGTGPLELAYGIRREEPDPRAYQRIYRNDGSYRERFATETEFHATHTHFHFKDFYVTELWRADRRYRLLGAIPVAVTKKNGFCPQDSAAHSGEGPARYSCRTEYEYGAGGIAQIVGISPGYTDAYGYEIADQFLEVSDVPDGIYVLRISIDPDDRIVESDERNNAICMPIRLDGDKAAFAGKSGRCVSAPA